MIDAHVHCDNCRRVIATDIKIAGGKTKPAEIRLAQTVRVVPGPQGIGVITVNVPICNECGERMDEEQKSAAASRLIVPQSGPLRPV